MRDVKPRGLSRANGPTTMPEWWRGEAAGISATLPPFGGRNVQLYCKIYWRRPGRLGNFFGNALALGLLALVRVEMAFAQPNRFRRDLDQFVFLDIGERALQHLSLIHISEPTRRT